MDCEDQDVVPAPAPRKCWIEPLIEVIDAADAEAGVGGRGADLAIYS